MASVLRACEIEPARAPEATARSDPCAWVEAYAPPKAKITRNFLWFFAYLVGESSRLPRSFPLFSPSITSVSRSIVIQAVILSFLW